MVNNIIKTLKTLMAIKATIPLLIFLLETSDEAESEFLK
jgi:hypothetical protein